MKFEKFVQSVREVIKTLEEVPTEELTHAETELLSNLRMALREYDKGVEGWQ